MVVFKPIENKLTKGSRDKGNQGKGINQNEGDARRQGAQQQRKEEDIVRVRIGPGEGGRAAGGWAPGVCGGTSFIWSRQKMKVGVGFEMTT